MIRLWLAGVARSAPLEQKLLLASITAGEKVVGEGAVHLPRHFSPGHTV